ncbi:MAG: hypothetical protein AB8F26_03365 [Phycisphaerales bacterium]
MARRETFQLALLIGLTLFLITGCGQARTESRPKIDPAQAERLGLSSDAVDPTASDIDKGYYRWRAKPEPDGTEDPTSPDRRKIGAPNG